MGAAVGEWAYENGVTVILIEDENVVGAMIGLDGEMAGKVTVGRGERIKLRYPWLPPPRVLGIEAALALSWSLRF